MTEDVKYPCIQGSVVVNSPITTDSPFVLDHDGVRYNGEIIVTLKKEVITLHDRIEIVKGLNDAYQKGYANGFITPKYK